MESGISREFAAKRVAVLAETILWGNAHFELRNGLAVASNKKAYTVKNLQYAAALMEATAEKRTVELTDNQAVARANEILERVLTETETSGKPPSAFPRFFGGQTPRSLGRLATDQVLPVLAFLSTARSRLRVSEEAIRCIDRCILSIVREYVEVSKTPFHVQEGAGR